MADPARDESPPDDFYIGYAPRAPAALARFVRRRAIGWMLACIGLALALTAAQAPFGTGTFEYGTTRTLEGIAEELPAPALLVDRTRDGIGAETGTATQSRYWLVAPGKHGAAELVAGRAGARVRLSGTLVYRGDQTMVEVVPDSIVDLAPAPRVVATGGDALDAFEDLGAQRLVGEIVDSKCYFGVMKPGNSKPHRSCAVRCISGGIPPVLLVRTFGGDTQVYLLVSESGTTLREEVLDYVAEPVEVAGRVQKSGDTYVLRVPPNGITRYVGVPDRNQGHGD